MYYWDEMTDSPHYEIGSGFALADKSDDILDICGTTSSNRAGAWSRHEFALIFPTTQQSSAFSMSPRTSPLAASGATNVKNVVRFSASENPPFIS